MSDQETRVAEWAARKEQDARIGRAVSRAARREAIATAVLAGLCSTDDPIVRQYELPEELAEAACDLADELIAELDRRRQAEEAQA